MMRDGTELHTIDLQFFLYMTVVKVQLGGSLCKGSTLRRSGYSIINITHLIISTLFNIIYIKLTNKALTKCNLRAYY